MSETDIRTEVFEHVRQVVAEVLKISEDQVTLESRYQEDLHADSFDLLSLVMALEDEFDRPLEDEGTLQLASVGETVDFIVSRSGSAPAAVG
ncbi:MAG TPA: acyl carrier protein [Thermoanaerobaculia bacterium]|nr:acyl carrier protein [Thermoanaerobaculia bacterium]